MHVVIVHGPIILLLLAPIFVIVGIGLSDAIRRLFLASALTLMMLGTAMTLVAVATGKAVMRTGSPTPAFQPCSAKAVG